MTYLYSRAAASRILGCQLSQIKDFQIWANVVWLWVENQRPRFVSKRWFKEHFSLWRQVQGARLRRKGMIQMHAPGAYTVLSARKPDKFHTVTVSDRHIDCSCGDFKKQQELFGKGCCKHGYGVLQSMGFSDLRSYIHRQR